MRHLFYLHNLPLPDKGAAQKKMKNKILARLYIYFPYGEISNNFSRWGFGFLTAKTLGYIFSLKATKI